MRRKNLIDRELLQERLLDIGRLPEFVAVEEKLRGVYGKQAVKVALSVIAPQLIDELGVTGRAVKQKDVDLVNALLGKISADFARPSERTGLSEDVIREARERFGNGDGDAGCSAPGAGCASGTTDGAAGPSSGVSGVCPAAAPSLSRRPGKVERGFFDGRKCSETAAVIWACENQCYTEVRPEDAPSALAWHLYVRIQKDPDIGDEYMKTYLSAKLRKGETDDGGGDLFDGERQYDLLRAIAAKHYIGTPSVSSDSSASEVPEMPSAGAVDAVSDGVIGEEAEDGR